MIKITKKREPRKLLEYRRLPGASYENMDGHLKQIILEHLLEEQGHLCAYCMRRIPETRKLPAGVSGATIEHWFPRNPESKEDHGQGLDYKNMLRISEHLKALAQKGKTILIITHDYEFAAMTCNRVLHFIDEGHAETFPLQGSLPRLYSCLMCQ